MSFLGGSPFGIRGRSFLAEQGKNFSFLFFSHGAVSLQDRPISDHQALSDNVANNNPGRLDLYFFISLYVGRNLSTDESGGGNDFSRDSCVFADSDVAVDQDLSLDFPLYCRCPFEEQLAVCLGSGTQVGANFGELYCGRSAGLCHITPFPEDGRI